MSRKVSYSVQSSITEYYGALETLIFSQVWRKEVWDHSASLVGIWWEPSSTLQTVNCLSYPQSGGEQRGEASSLCSPPMRALIPPRRAPPSWPHQILISSQWPHLFKALHLRDRVSTSEFGGNANIQSINRETITWFLWGDSFIHSKDHAMCSVHLQCPVLGLVHSE